MCVCGFTEYTLITKYCKLRADMILPAVLDVKSSSL